MVFYILVLSQDPPEMDLVLLQPWLDSWQGLFWRGALLLLHKSTKVQPVAKVSWERLGPESFFYSPQATRCFALFPISNNSVSFHLKIRMKKKSNQKHAGLKLHHAAGN